LLVTNDLKLGVQSRIIADEAQGAGELSVSAISWWEIGILAEDRKKSRSLMPEF